MFMLFKDVYIDDLYLAKSVSSWLRYVPNGAQKTLSETFALGLLKPRFCLYVLLVHNLELKSILYN